MVNMVKLQGLSSSKEILLTEQLCPLTDDQKAVIDNRLTGYSAEPEAGDSWEIVKNRISDSRVIIV